MSGRISSTPVLDRQAVLARDGVYQRKLQMNLERKFLPRANARWKEHQDSQYLHTLQIRDTPSLQNLIANDLESKNQADPLQSSSLAMTNLLTISDSSTANYILDRLDDADILALNQNFPNLVQTIKKKFDKLNKDAFVALVKSQTTDYPPQDITERGQNRVNMVSELAKAQEAQYQSEVSAQMNAQRASQKAFSDSMRAERPSAFQKMMEQIKNRQSDLRTPAKSSSSSSSSSSGSSSGSSSSNSKRNRGEEQYGNDDESDAGMRASLMYQDNDDYNYDTDASTATNNSPSKAKTNPYYREILKTSYPDPQNDRERQILRRVEAEVRSIKTKTKVADYIDNLNQESRVKVGTNVNANQLRDIAVKTGYSNATETTGKGLKIKKRLIRGGGSPVQILKSAKKMELNDGKFTIDLEKLKNNILSVVYTSCRGSIPNLKREHISNDVKNMISDIIQEKYNVNLFKKMTDTDKRIISTFVRTLKIKGIDMDEFDNEFQERYEILQGEISAGNDNPKIKAELKKYILRGMQEGMIPRAQALTQLFDLSV